MKDTRNFDTLPKEKFVLANKGDFISDTVFKDKPIGSFKDAWIRFRRNKASIVAAGIILLIFLFAFLTPLLNRGYDATFLDPRYARMGPRNLALSKIGIATGTIDYSGSEKNLVRVYSIGVAALDTGNNKVAIKDTYGDKYQPVREITGETSQYNILTKSDDMFYTAKVDTYLNLGYVYLEVEQAEYQKILDWQTESGIQVLYPLIASNKYNPNVPYDDKSAVSVALKHIKEKFPSARKFNSQTPVIIDKIIQKACMKNPHERYNDVFEMRKDIDRILREPNLIKKKSFFERLFRR